MTFKLWCQAMEKKASGDYSGLIHLSNLLFDCTYGRVKPSIVKAFLDYILREWPYYQPSTTRKYFPPEKLLKGFVTDNSAVCLVKGKPINPTPIQCSRVVKFEDLYAFNIDKNSDMGDLDEGGYFEPDDRKRIIDEGYNYPIGSMQGSRPLCWVTQSGTIDDYRNDVTSGKDFPTLVMERLGLDDYDKMPDLVEILYPPDFGLVQPLHAPTIFDHGDHQNLIYRSDEHHATPEWGCTVDISNSGCGAPEAVHPPILFSSQFRMKDIGVPKPQQRCDYESIFNNASAQWQKDQNFYTVLDNYCSANDNWA